MEIVSETSDSSTQFTVQIKWGRMVFQNVLLDTSEPVKSFKKEIASVTGVPVERQKLLCASLWKGYLLILMLYEGVKLFYLFRFII